MIKDYLYTNYALFIMLGGIFILSLQDVFLEKRMIIKLRTSVFFILMLSISDHLEAYFRDITNKENIWRYIFSAISYSLRPLIIMMMILMVYNRAKRLIIIPALINIALSFSWIFSGVVFAFDENNVFVRGPLGYTPYFISAIYLIGLLFVSIRVVSERSYEESSILFFICLAAVLVAALGLWMPETGVLVNHTFGADVLLYYLYTYSQFTKRDSLTGLYNRQSYYSAIQKNDITGVISIDMNELKWLNDSCGHGAGDKGLRAVSESIKTGMEPGNKAYRIGGDEFVILCRNYSEDLKASVDKIRNAVIERGYSCAFGYSDKGTVKEMLKEADRLMYEDKAKIKEEMKQKGVELHPRN